MSRIFSVFQRHGRVALIPYVTVGYPSIEATLKVVPLLARCGCDIVELGIPFSDPLADGATIQNASFQALHNGITPRVCLEVAGELRKTVEVPMVFMTYFNPVLSYGVEKFCRACKKSGIDGLIIPDLPPEEALELEETTRKLGLDLIYLLAPTSSAERVRVVGERSRGFIYLVSVTGVTGARNSLPENLEIFVTGIKKQVTQPVCVGFGIATPEQARRVARIADGVIVGSRLIQIMENSDFVPAVTDFIKGLRRALDSAGKEK